MSIESETIPPGTRRRFPWIALLAWAIVAFAVPRAALSLNVVHVLGFPLGYFMMAQGCLLALVLVAILSARRQDRIAAAAPEPH